MIFFLKESFAKKRIQEKKYFVKKKKKFKKKYFVNIFKRAKFSKKIFCEEKEFKKRIFLQRKTFSRKRIFFLKIFCEYFLFLDSNFQKKKWRKVFEKESFVSIYIYIYFRSGIFKQSFTKKKNSRKNFFSFFFYKEKDF